MAVVEYRASTTTGNNSNTTIHNEQVFFIFGDVNLMGYVPPWIPTLYIIINILVFIFGVAGNFIIIVIYRRTKPKKPCDWFILFIAYMDIIVCACHPWLNLRLEFRWEITWDFHGFVCALESLINFSAMMSSCFLLGLMALERYIIVCRPTVAPLTGDTAKIVCYGLLVLSVGVCLYPSVVQIVMSGCVALEQMKNVPKAYMLSMFFIFCLCFVIVIVSYANVIRTIEIKIKVKKRLLSYNGLHDDNKKEIKKENDDLKDEVFEHRKLKFNCFNYLCKKCNVKKRETQSEGKNQNIKIEIYDTGKQEVPNNHQNSNVRFENVKLSSQLENKLNDGRKADAKDEKANCYESDQLVSLPREGSDERTKDVIKSMHNADDHTVPFDNTREIIEADMSSSAPTTKTNGCLVTHGNNDALQCGPAYETTMVDQLDHANDSIYASSWDSPDNSHMHLTNTDQNASDGNSTFSKLSNIEEESVELEKQYNYKAHPSPSNLKQPAFRFSFTDGTYETDNDEDIEMFDKNTNSGSHNQNGSAGDNKIDENHALIAQGESNFPKTIVQTIEYTEGTNDTNETTNRKEDSSNIGARKTKGSSSSTMSHISLTQQRSLESYLVEDDLYSDVQPVTFFLRRAKEKMNDLQDKLVKKKATLSTCSHRRKKWMKERRMTLMLFSITFIFLIAWIPPWSLYLCFMWGHQPFKSHTAVRIAYRYWEKTNLIQYCTNFTIYYTFNPGFRKKVKKLWMSVYDKFRCQSCQICHKCRKPSESLDAERAVDV